MIHICVFFFFNDTATTEIYTYGHTLSLHDALPILLGPAQRADRAGDAGVHVGTGTGDHASGEGAGVELVLRVQDQRLVHRLRVQRARRRAAQQVQEVRGDRVVIGLDVDAAAIAGEVPPEIGRAHV